MKDYLRASIERVRIMYNFYPELQTLSIILVLGIIAHTGVVVVMLNLLKSGL